MGSSCTGIAFVALVSFRAFEVRIIFQGVFIQRNQYSFIVITANFLRLQTIAKIKLQIANRHVLCNLGTACIHTTCNFTAGIDLNGQIHHSLQLCHVNCIRIVEASS